MTNGRESHNMFLLMQVTFQQWWVVIVYILGCISLAWHLVHGFQSAFRTFGVYNKRYLTMLNALGTGFSIIVPLIFALMPLAFKLGWIGEGN
jgi:succinate dehydrogenase / fumarate reductase cytochrome b subunit